MKRTPYAQREAGPHRHGELAAAALDGETVVELRPTREPEPAPQLYEPAGDLPFLLAGKDLYRRSMSSEVDRVECIERDRALEVAGTDEIDLVDRIGL
ncbi:MAG TPA: hypothetical protein VEV82_09345 [Actinomycetota bacterium]|nr:hypothetical protein [Actinomycetota bacterium]